jgi:hypothetical protein
MMSKLNTETHHIFWYKDLEDLVKELYALDISILDTIPFEHLGQHTYHIFTIDGVSELDSIGDAEVYNVWVATGQTEGIDQSNDPDWDPAWNEFGTTADVEVKHILHRLYVDDFIPAGKYLMTVSW